MAMSRSSRARSREMTRVARRECPPRSKKWSRTPIGPSPSTSSQTSTTVRSIGVRGATCARCPPPEPGSGAGSALRSVFPFGVSGSASSTTSADGTIAAGRDARTKSSTAAGSPPPSRHTTYPASSRSAPSPCAAVTARATSG